MHNSYRVGVLDLVQSKGDGKAKTLVGSRLLQVCLLIFCMDVSCSVAAVFAFHGWSSSHAFQMSDVLSFSHDVLDCLFVTVVRSLFLPVLTGLAITVAKPRYTKSPAARAKQGTDGQQGEQPQESKLSAPLLVATSSTKDADDIETEAAASGSAVKKEEWERGRLASQLASDMTRQGQKHAAAIRKHAVLTCLFALSTGSQVYVGIKSLNFEWDRHGGNPFVVAILVCVSVLFVNIEAWLLREYVNDCTRDDGLLMKKLHPHPLFYDDQIARHWCDLCSTCINTAWRCKLCDFDACPKCVGRKRTAAAGENLVRSDGGVRQTKSMSSFQYFVRSMKLAGSEYKLFLIAFVFLVLTATATLALPHSQGLIIDDIDHKDRSLFLLHLKIYLSTMVALGVFNGIKGLLFTIVARRIAFHARTKLFNALMKQDIAFFDGTTSGRLTSRLTNDIGMMLSPIQTTLSTCLYNIVMLLGGVVMCFITSYQLSMLAFTTVGPILYLWDMYANWSRRLNRLVLSALSEANSVATQALGNIRTVKAFSNEKQELGEYGAATESALEQGIKDAWGYALTSAVTNYLDLGAGMLILSVGGLLVLNGSHQITVGKLVAFQLYWNYMNTAYQSLQNIVTSFTRAAAAAERVFSLLDLLPDIDNTAKGEHIDWEVKGELNLSHVHFAYQMRSEKPVLQDLSLVIPAGSTCALVGRSGGGKTTLVHMLLRFYDPQQGTLSLDGRDVKGLKIQDFRKLFGIVSQDTQLFARTIRQNIAYGTDPSKATQSAIEAAARRARAHDFIMDFPEGYETRVGERGLRISGGQRQRIAIARVLLRQPKIMLLDEATSALDAENEAMVQNAIDELIRDCGSTVILVAHRLSTVMNADLIAVVDKGRIVERGSHDQLLQADGIYASLVRKQLAKRANTIDEDDVDAADPACKVADDIDSLMDALEKDKKKQQRQTEAEGEGDAAGATTKTSS